MPLFLNRLLFLSSFLVNNIQNFVFFPNTTYQDLIHFLLVAPRRTRHRTDLPPNVLESLSIQVTQPNSRQLSHSLRALTNMDTIFNTQRSWNDTIARGLSQLADYGYHITLTPSHQSTIAGLLQTLLSTLFSCLTLYLHHHYTCNTQNSAHGMLLYCIYLTAMSYFGQLWIASPMDAFARMRFEHTPMAAQSILLAVWIIFKFFKETSREKQKKLQLLSYFQGVVICFFLIIFFEMKEKLISEGYQGIASNSRHEVRCFKCGRVNRN